MGPRREVVLVPRVHPRQPRSRADDRGLFALKLSTQGSKQTGREGSRELGRASAAWHCEWQSCLRMPADVASCSPPAPAGIPLLAGSGGLGGASVPRRSTDGPSRGWPPPERPSLPRRRAEEVAGAAVLEPLLACPPRSGRRTCRARRPRGTPRAPSGRLGHCTRATSSGTEGRGPIVRRHVACFATRARHEYGCSGSPRRPSRRGIRSDSDRSPGREPSCASG
jgi:hypothetical protein